jgi:hypothetical protein
VLDDLVPPAARPEPEARHRGSEHRDDRRTHGRGQVERCRVVGDQYGRPGEQRRRRAQPELARGAVHPAWHLGDDVSAQARILPAPDDHRRAIERRGQRGIAGPALGSPDRSRRDGHESRRDPARAQPPVGLGHVVGGERDVNRRCRQRAAGQRQQALHLVPIGRPDHAPGVAGGGRAVGEAHALADPREPSQGRRPPRSMRKVGAKVAPRPQLPAQPPHSAKPALGPALVIAEDHAHRGVGLEQDRRRRRGHHVHRSMHPGERGEERSGQNDIAEKGGLDDQGP